MRLTFLGTGTSQGVPVIACHCAVCRSSDGRDTRLRTSALLQIERGKSKEEKSATGYQLPANILFDIGPDFRQQMLRHDVDHLDAILITHAHRDHVGGLDDIRSFNYVQQRKMDIYLNREARVAIERDYHYIFEPHQYPGLPEANLHTVGSEEFGVVGRADGAPRNSEFGVRTPSSLASAVSMRQPTPNSEFLTPNYQLHTAHCTLPTIKVTPIAAMHKDLPILGYRIGKLAYITDANYIAESEMEKLKGVEVLVLNALRKEHHFSHYSLPEALEVIGRVAPREAYLTHISHDMGLHADVDSQLPAGVHLAYDNLTIEI